MTNMKRTFTAISIGMLLLALALPAAATYCPSQGSFPAQQGPYIGGTVTDADSGLPVKGVSLGLYCCDNGHTYDQTSTDSNGQYSFGGETQSLGFWIGACYNVRIEDTCVSVVGRTDITLPNCPRLGEEDCFHFANCDDSERYEVNFTVRNLCNQGCSLGYWRHHLSQWPAAYNPGDDFDTTFGVDLFNPDITLLQALWRRGGGDNALARQAVGAILNAANPDIAYPLSADQVIALVQAGDARTLALYNKLGCPLNGPNNGDDEDDEPSHPHGKKHGRRGKKHS